MALTDPLNGNIYSFGAILPSGHVSTVWNQQPRAVDGGFLVAGAYPADISFSGDHTHTGNFTHNGPGIIDAAATSLAIGAITADSLTFASAEETPHIRQGQRPGDDGDDGVRLPIEAQQGQSGGSLLPGGDGGDLELGAGLPGPGTADGAIGRLIKQWGDSAGYKWLNYSWCSGEVLYTASTSYPLVVDIADGEIHACEAFIIARSLSPVTDVELNKIYAVGQNNSGTVTFSSPAAPPNFSVGAVNLANFSFQPGASPNEWRIALSAVSTSGDAVIFIRWAAVSLDGA
jgi:hypothetical protein